MGRVISKILHQKQKQNENKKNLKTFKDFSLIFRRIFRLAQSILEMNRPSSGLQGCSDGRGGLIRHLTPFENTATPTNRCMQRNFSI